MLPKHALYQMSYTEKTGSRRWDRTIDHWLMRPTLYH